MSEKYYILHYPSSWGMGTNTDIRLVSDCDIRRLIRAELDKKMKNNRFDDRFTGTWNEEKFCDSDDIEEVVEDVIYKRLNTNSTYAPANDLVIVPNSVSIIRTDFEIKNTIFRICNQFDCVTDVIAGEGIFRSIVPMLFPLFVLSRQRLRADLSPSHIGNTALPIPHFFQTSQTHHSNVFHLSEKLFFVLFP